MIEDSLRERRVAAEQEFNALQIQKEQKEQEIQQVLAEQLKLQGEMRLIDAQVKPVLGAGAVSPAPNTIDIDKALEDDQKNE